MRIHQQQLIPELVSVSDYLAFKELLVRPDSAHEPVLELDFAPFNRGFPRLKEIRSIGQGVIFLNKQLAGTLFTQSWHGIGQAVAFFNRALHGRAAIDASAATLPMLRRYVAGLRRALGLLDKYPGRCALDDDCGATERIGLCTGLGRLCYAGERYHESVGRYS